MSAGSTRRVPGVSSGALYRRSTPRTRSSLAFGTLPGRVAVATGAGAARAEAADPRPYKTGIAGRAAPSIPRRVRTTPSVRSGSASSRLSLMMFTHIPLVSSRRTGSTERDLRVCRSRPSHPRVNPRAGSPGRSGGPGARGTGHGASVPVCDSPRVMRLGSCVRPAGESPGARPPADRRRPALGLAGAPGLPACASSRPRNRPGANTPSHY